MLEMVLYNCSKQIVVTHERGSIEYTKSGFKLFQHLWHYLWIKPLKNGSSKCIDYQIFSVKLINFCLYVTGSLANWTFCGSQLKV